MAVPKFENVRASGKPEIADALHAYMQKLHDEKGEHWMELVAFSVQQMRDVILTGAAENFNRETFDAAGRAFALVMTMALDTYYPVSDDQLNDASLGHPRGAELRADLTEFMKIAGVIKEGFEWQEPKDAKELRERIALMKGQEGPLQ